MSNVTMNEKVVPMETNTTEIIEKKESLWARIKRNPKTKKVVKIALNVLGAAGILTVGYEAGRKYGTAAIPVEGAVTEANDEDDEAE